MPEYTLAGIAWLAGSAVLAAVAGVLRQRRTWLALGIFLAFTVVFDAVLTGLPIVTYGDAHISGLRLGTTPLEDYLYGLALCLTAIASYELARRRWPTSRRDAGPPAPASGEPAASRRQPPDRP